MDIFTGLIKVVQDEGLKSASMRFDNWQESLEEMAESANQEELAAIHVLRASLHKFEGNRNLFEEMSSLPAPNVLSSELTQKFDWW